MTDIVPELPAYLPVLEVAKHAGVEPGTYERYLRRKGATIRMGHDRVVVTDVLREVEPNVFERIFAARALDTDESGENTDEPRQT